MCCNKNGSSNKAFASMYNTFYITLLNVHFYIRKYEKLDFLHPVIKKIRTPTYEVFIYSTHNF